MLKTKRVIAYLLTLAMFLSVLPLYISAEEIPGALEIPNSGFENGDIGSVPESWKASGSANSAFVSSEEHYSGSNSMKLTRSGGTPSRGLRSSEIEITGGTTYYVQSMIKGDATLVQMYIEYWAGTPDYEKASNRTTQIFSKTPTDSWSRLSGILKAPDDATLMTVCFYMNNSCAGTVYFDDVTAYPEAEQAVIARLNEDFSIEDEALIWEDLSSSALTLSGVNSAYEQLYTYSLIKEYKEKDSVLTKADIQSVISNVNSNIVDVQTEIIENFADTLDTDIVISSKGVVNVPEDAYKGMTDMGGNAKWTAVSGDGAKHLTLTDSSLILDSRPSYDSVDATVTLTLTLSKNGAAVNVPYNAVIGKYESSAEQTLEALGFDTVKGENTNPMRITSDLDLPETIGGMTVVWNSSNTDVIAIDGTVTRPADVTEYVKLTASIGETTVVIDLAVLPENDESEALWVENSDFEVLDTDGLPKGWANSNGKLAPEGSFSADSSIKFSGKTSLKINGNGTKQIGIYSSGSFGITQGNTYRASAMVYSDSDVTPQMYLKFYNIYSLELSSHTAVMTGNKGEWNEISVEGTAPAGAVMARLIPFVSTGKAGSFYADSITLSELPLVSKGGWTEKNGVKTSENVPAISGIEYVVTGYNGTEDDTVALNFYAPGDVLLVSHSISADSESRLRAYCPDGASYLNITASADITGDIQLLPNFSGTQISDGSFESMGSTDTSAWTNAEKAETTIVEVANGNFEANTLVAETEWFSIWDSSTVCLTNEDSYSGNQSLKVRWSAASGKGGGTRSKRTAVTPGEQISFDAMYKSNGKTDVYVEFWDADDKRITDTAQSLPLVQTLEAADKWTAMPQVNVTVPSNAKELSIIFYHGSYKEKEDITSFFDNVSITHKTVLSGAVSEWSSSNATAVYSNADSYSGDHSMLLNVTKANGNARGPKLEITAGETYTVSTKYKSGTGTGKLYLYVEYWDEAGTTRLNNNINASSGAVIRKQLTVSTDWASGSHSFKAPSGAKYISALFLFDAASSVYIDDVTITASTGNSITVPNGDFENDGDEVFVDVLPWTSSVYNGNATASAQFTSAEKYSGKQSILFTTTRANAYIISEKLPATEGVTYTISMKYKSHEGSSNLYLYVDYYDDAGNRKGYNVNTTRKLMPRSTEWTTGTHKVKAPTGATKICALILYDGLSSAYIDDISITGSDGSVLELPYSDFESKKPTAQPEVLFSDDFEQAGTIKDTWYKTSTVALTYETVNDNVYEGNKAAYLSGRNGIRSEAVSVLPGEIYTANTNYITQSRYMRIYLEFWNGDPKLSTSTRQSSAYIDLPKSATWADGATTQLTVPSDCMYATVSLYFANENGSGYFDNVHLERFEASGSFESMLDTENATDGSYAIKLTDNETISGLISVLSGKDYRAAVDINGDADITLTFYDAQGNEMEAFAESGSGNTTVILDATAPKKAFGAKLTLKAVGETFFDNARIYPITDSVSNYSFEVVPYTFGGKQLGYHWESFGDVAAKTISMDNLNDGALATEIAGAGETGGIRSSMVRVKPGVEYAARADIDGNANIGICFYDEELNFVSKGTIAPDNAAFACVEITVSRDNTAIVDNVEFSEAVIDIADRTQLFVDDYMIAETDLERIVHEAEKTAPILEANVDNEWETNGAYLYGSVLYDDKDGLYKMWYQSYNASYVDGGDAASVMACYATSTDGIHWETPNLGIVNYNGNTNNNMLGNYHIQTVFIDEDADESKRYKMFCYAHKYGKVYTSFYSADGINWTKEKDFVEGSDVMCVEYDEVNDRYFAILKLGGGFGKRDQWTMRTDSEGNWYAPVMANTLADLLDARYCYRPDAYGMGIYERDGLYLGFDWAFRIPGTNIMEGTVSPQLTVSRDLAEEWRRVSHEAIVPIGEKGELDDGMICTASYPIEMGDEVWLYCGAWDNDHGNTDRNASTFIAKWRLDGFASMSGTGTLTTKPVSFDGNALYLNANAEKGSITVSLLDKDGNTIPGFEQSDAIKSDSVNNLVTFGGKCDLSSLAGEEVVIKLDAENADIYAFTFGEAPAVTESEVEITVAFDREEDSKPYNDDGYDNRARLNIYTDESKSETVESVILEDGEAASSTVSTALTLEQGEYYAEIVKNGYITCGFTITVDGMAVKLPEIKLTAGDIAASYEDLCGDGKVDIDDFIRVLRGFSAEADEKIRMRVDINEDGVVNVADIAIIKKNFGK